MKKGFLIVILFVVCFFLTFEVGIHPLLFYAICAIVIGGGYLLYMWIQSSIKEKKEKKAKEIKGLFPLAYKQFIVEINKGKSFLYSLSDLEIAEKVIERPIELWRNEEERLQQEEKERKETAKKVASIAGDYPHGIKKWKEENRSYTSEAIIAHENDIRQYEGYYKTSLEFNQWEKEQSEFTQKCRDVGPKVMPNFGCYKYNIPFEKQSDNGKMVSGEYNVWQFFPEAYCLESDLNYTDFEYIKQSTNSIGEVKTRSRQFSPSVYEHIQDFIKKLAEDYKVSIYLCANNNEWTVETLNYYYGWGKSSPFYDLSPTLEICDPAADAWFDEKEIDYNKYPQFDNRHIIVVELQTGNHHLKEVCKNIIEKNKDKKPLITYISFLKGYDRDEMLELIEKKKKEKAEEERKKQEEIKKQEIEKSIKELPSLVDSNNIEQIESKIHFIDENLNYVTEDFKEEYEDIKIDYNSKKDIGIPQDEELLFVNYDIPQVKTEKGYYAIVRMPQKGCVVWPYRRRTIARRGYTESLFENELKKYFGNKIQVLGDVNILPQNGARPYEPDVALIYSDNNFNLRIDIEIDEPYAALTNKPTHYIGCGDDNRDANLNCLGWIVIRFSERQVFKQTIGCVKFVADVIKCIDNTFDVLELANVSALVSEKQWTKIECQRMATDRIRQDYLNHEFGRTEEAIYNVKDLKLTAFEASILDKVKHPVVTIPEHKTTIIEEDFNNDNNLLYNKTNRFEQDQHIKFFAAQHIYTVDGIQYKSVSSVISELFPEFDTEYWSNVKGKERGVSPEQVAEEWESKGRESREVGTFLHQQIENHFLNKPISLEYHYKYQGSYVQEDCIDYIDLEFGYFKDFLEETTINPFRSEWRIFDKSLKLAGTIDLITKNEDGSYTIYDWKRSSRLFQNNPYQHGFGELAHLEDSPITHYSLQQNLYRYILEHQYGLKIQSMKLVGLHPDYMNHVVINVHKMDKEISTIIKML